MRACATVEQRGKVESEVLAPIAFVLLGLLGFLVAYRKGRRRGPWLIAAVLLGPLTLIAALLVSRRER